jgi:type III pantothenate kinase
MNAGVNILAIDAGNSRIKWGIADGSGWLRRGWLATREAHALGAALKDLPVPVRIVVSNVAGERVREALVQALAGYGVAPVWVTGRDAQCGVRSGYADPSQLGPDRWAGLIAAWKLHGNAHEEGRACVVVNAGTTMTVDALSAEGVFLGGIIVPGLDLMRASLDSGTAQLRMQQGAFYYFPDNTADAIMSGAINALTGAIDRMCGYMAETGQGTALVVLSGGVAALIQPRLNVAVALVDNLVLEGLLEIAKQK